MDPVCAFVRNRCVLIVSHGPNAMLETPMKFWYVPAMLLLFGVQTVQAGEYTLEQALGRNPRKPGI
jgi:hypothetical protein